MRLHYYHKPSHMSCIQIHTSWLCLRNTSTIKTSNTQWHGLLEKESPWTLRFQFPNSILGACTIETRSVKFGYMELERFLRLVSSRSMHSPLANACSVSYDTHYTPCVHHAIRPRRCAILAPLYNRVTWWGRVRWRFVFTALAPRSVDVGIV